MPSIPEEDRLFGELVVAQGLCTRVQVDECLSVVARLIDGGVSPIPRLGEILARKGYLSATQAEATMRDTAARHEGSRPRATVLPPEAAAAEADPANRVGKYVRVSKLGAGGMGEVWKAWDRELGRWAALKFMRHDDPGELARFQREAQTAAKLSHPNIASVYEVGESGGKPYIAMQLVPGRTLAAFPRDDRRLLAEILRDAALAVHHAHEQGVIHRDLKPQNLMVETQKGLRPRVYVMDFGLAKPTAVQSSLSLSGMILGTPAYMAPEQARGEAHRVTAASDVYSLGATLYELLSDRPPFHETEVYALIKKVIEEDPRPLRERNPKVDRDLETIVMKCLEKDPARRYATALQLADDLGRYLAGEAILAHPPSTAYRVGKFFARRKAVTAVAAGGLAAVTLTAALLVPRWLEERARREVEAGEARRREESLKRLSALWSSVVLEKQGLYNPSNDPKRVIERIRRSVAGVDSYVRDHPDHPQGWYVRARGKHYLDDLDGAEQDLRKAVSLEPGFAPGHALLARVLLDQYGRRMYGDPLTHGERARQAEPLLQEARDRLAKGWKEGSEALSVSKWGLPRTPEDEVAETLTRALADYHLANDRSEATARLRAANEREEVADYCNVLGGWAAEPREQVEWQTRALRRMAHYAKAYIDRARPRFDLGETDGAIDDLTKAIEISPVWKEAHNNRGILRKQKGDLAGARADFDKAIELDPGYAAAHANRGNLRQSTGDLDGALADLSRAIELEPRSANSYGNRAGVRRARGDVDGAIADLTKGLELDPKSAFLWNVRGNARRAKGDIAGALDDHTKAIEADPRYASAYNSRANTRSAGGDAKGAIEDLTLAVEVDPRYTEAYYNRGNAWNALGERDRAVADYSKAVELNPRFAPAWYNRGIVRHAAGDVDGAIGDWAKAIEADPRHVEAMINRSNAWRSKGEHAKAIEDATRAMQVSPKWGQPHAARGFARAELSSLDAARRRELLDGAREDLEKALQLVPADWPHRKSVVDSLEWVRAQAGK